MANRTLFTSAARVVPFADTRNDAGGRAYQLAPKAALAQMAVTGVFNNTFYTTAEKQLDRVKELAAQVDVEYLAKLALYTREKAFMKDMPAYFAATLAARDVLMLAKVFDRVLDNGKMLRNFVQVIRSGVVGRKSLGTRPKKLVANWLNMASDAQILHATVGNSPSLQDVIRLSHPKAFLATRNAFFGHVVGRKVEAADLPDNVRALEAFRKSESREAVPNAPFELLTAMNLTDRDWAQIARQASWTQTRMNLNTFLRHNVFDSREMVELVAARLRDPELVRKAKVFPYQLLAAYLNISDAMPGAIADALQDAMEVAVENVPKFDGEVAVLVDCSWSMEDPVTGKREGSTSKVRCVDVAALFASAILRKNPTSRVVPFDTRVLELRLNGRDSVVTNAKRLAEVGKGGTDCAVGLAELNRLGSTAETVVCVSDNESWVETGAYGARAGRGTAFMAQWKQYKLRVPKAKLVCIDITPNVTSQAKENGDVLNIGGFSDEVFNIVNLFAQNKLSAAHWVGEIERVTL